jgi:integrase
VYNKNGHFGVRVTLGPKDRRKVALKACVDQDAADKRGVVVATLARRMRAAGLDASVTLNLLKLAGERDEKGLVDVLGAADALCKYDARAKLPSRERTTFQDVGERWTSGELARAYPDQVKVKATAAADRRRLERYVYPLVRGVTVAAFTLDHAERVMAALPPNRVRAPATRRHVAQLVHRILELAVYPLRIITANPLPRGFRPKVGEQKAKGWLYPDEDRKLLACGDVPLCRRFLYGFLHREGLRFGEAAALELRDVDRDRGVLTLDQNKTNDPRTWKLGPDVLRAVRAMLAKREAAAGVPLGRDAPLFVDESGGRVVDTEHHRDHAKRFRGDLARAGIERDELTKHDKSRMRIRVHDTRASFVTLAMASGRNEAWVQDRTGHRSSYMINRYRRAARMAEELDLGWFAPLDEAIPELKPASENGSEGNAASGRDPSGAGPSAREDEGESGAAPPGPPLAAEVSAQSSAGDARAPLVADLARHMARLLAVGDLDTARLAHEAIGQVLAAPSVSLAPVVDLAVARGRRADR